jgi:putative membrane protein insertion efficiency factor
MKAALLFAIHLYQRLIGPQIRSRRCRFTPTCSHYAAEAIERHGAVRGLRLARRRLARCRPGFPGGEDLVPQADASRR